MQLPPLSPSCFRCHVCRKCEPSSGNPGLLLWVALDPRAGRSVYQWSDHAGRRPEVDGHPPAWSVRHMDQGGFSSQPVRLCPCSLSLSPSLSVSGALPALASSVPDPLARLLRLCSSGASATRAHRLQQLQQRELCSGLNRARAPPRRRGLARGAIVLALPRNAFQQRSSTACARSSRRSEHSATTWQTTPRNRRPQWAAWTLR